MALLFTPAYGSSSASSGVQNSSLLSQQTDEDKRRKAREAAVKKDTEAVQSAQKAKDFQATLDTMKKSGQQGLPPRNPFDTSGDVASADTSRQEDQALLSVYGGKSVDLTPNAQKLSELDKRYSDVKSRIKSIEEQAAAPRPKKTLMQRLTSFAPPDPQELQKSRDALVAQMYDVEKQFHGLSSSLTQDDYDALQRQADAEKALYEINKKSNDTANAKRNSIPGAQAVGEAVAAPVRTGISLFGLLPGLMDRYEAVKKGRASLPGAIYSAGSEQKMVSDARYAASAPETIAGKASSVLSNIAGFGLEAYATAGLLSQIPVIAPLVNASKEAQIAGGTVKLAPTIAQGLTRGAFVFGAREGGVEALRGQGVHTEKVLTAAAEGAVFEGFVAPALGKVWRKVTTDRVGEATFIMSPNDAGALPAPALPGTEGGTSWIPKQVQQVYMNTKADVQGIQRRMIFSMDDGNIFEMRMSPQTDGTVALQITQDAPNWLKRGAMDLMAKFNGAGTGKSRVVDVKSQTVAPDAPAGDPVVKTAADSLRTTPEELTQTVQRAGNNLDSIDRELTKTYGKTYTDLKSAQIKAMEDGGSLGGGDFKDPIRKAVFGQANPVVMAPGMFKGESTQAERDALDTVISQAQGYNPETHVISKFGQNAVAVYRDFPIPKASLDSVLKNLPSKMGDLKLDPASITNVIDDAGATFKTGIEGKITDPVQVFYDTKTGTYSLQNGYHRLLETISRGDTSIRAEVVMGEKLGNSFYVGGFQNLVGAPAAAPSFGMDSVLQGASAPVVVDVPHAPPMPEPSANMTTIGVMSIQKFLGGEFYHTYKPFFDTASTKEKRMTQFASDKPPEVSGAGEKPVPKKEEPVPQNIAQSLGAFKDDPEIAPIHQELQDSTTELEQVVKGAEAQIAEVTPVDPETQKLVGLAKQIRELIPPTQRRLPGGQTRNEFFNDLATNGDSISAVTDRLKVIAEATPNPRFARDLMKFVNDSKATGNFDSLGDFAPFQNAITEKAANAPQPDLIERADKIIQQLGDFDIGEGRKVSDLLNEIDMLEFDLHDKIATRTAAKQPQRKTAKQTAITFDKGSDAIPRRASAGQRETVVSGRDLIKAVSSLSRAKEQKFRVLLRDAVTQAKQAQKAKLTDLYAAKKDEISLIKGNLVDEIRKMVPPERRGKFLATVKNVATRGQLQKALERVDAEVAAADRKQAVDRLKDISKVKLAELRPEYRAPIQELIDSVDPVKRTSKTLSGLQSLADYLKREPENQVPESRLAELGILSKKKIEELTTQEIADLHDSIAHLVHLNTMKNKLLIRGKVREYAKIREEAVQNVLNNHELKNGSITGLDSMQVEQEPGTLGKILTVDSYNAELKAEILDGMDAGVIRQVLYDGIDEGVTRQMRFEHTAEDFFKNRLAGIDMNRWSYTFQKKAANVDKVSVQISGARTLTMTKGERVAFLLHNMNPQNRKHLLEGGFSFPNTPSKILTLTEEDINAIEKSATDEEFKVAGAINEYLNTVQRESINQVSVDLLGHEVAREKDYFPIRTSFLDRFHDDLIKSGSFTQKTLEGMGLLKVRQNAGNALIVEDAFVALYKSIKQIGAYVGLAQPLRSAKMLLNDNELQIAARTAGKNHYITSLKDYLARIEGDSVNLENVDKIAFDLINKLDVAVLGLNPFVMVKQPVSYMNAATELEWKYLRRSALKIPTVADLAEMRTASPQLRDRMEGHVTREAGEIAEVGGPMKFFTGQTLFSQKFTAGLEHFDRMAIGRIWNAVKMETSEKHPELQGYEYMQKVARRAELVVRRTQSTSHVKDRSTIGMTKNMFMRMLTRFSSERNKAYMQIRRASERYNRSEKTPKDKANLFNAIFIVTMATPLVVIGIDAARDKIYGKDTKRTMFSTALDLVSNALGTVYFAGAIFDSLRSKIENGTYAGYDVDTSATQFVNQTIDTLAETAQLMTQTITQERYKSGSNSGQKKWSVTAKKLVFDFANTLAQMKGIPTTPVRAVKSVVDRLSGGTKKAPSSGSRSATVDRAGAMSRASTKRTTTQR